MNVIHFEGINTVDPEIWSQVVQGYPFSAWHWCQYGELAVGQPGHYLVALEGDKPVGGAIFWVMHRETVPTSTPFVEQLVNKYLNWRPLVVCRTPLLTDHKGLFVPADPGQQAEFLSEARRQGLEIARQHGGSFVLFDYLLAEEVDYDWGDFLKVKDFLNVGTCMHVEWDTFDDYMDALKETNKKAHKNVRHNIRYAEEERIVIHFQHETPPVEEIVRLLRIKLKRYKVKLDAQWARDIVRALSTLPEPNAMWVVACRDEKMVGCELLLNDDQSHVCKPVLYGRDYDVEYVYFPMCYEDIRYSIENLHAKTIIYDTEAYDFKRRMGFGPDRRNSLVFCPNSRLERALANGMSRFWND